MTLPRPAIDARDLLHGEDHDFVVNAYLALLGRWPDPAGYAHYTAVIQGRPDLRPEVLRSLAASEEARRPGRPGHAVLFPEDGQPLLPSDPLPALAVALDLRTRHLHGQDERLREALDHPGPAAMAAADAEIGAMRREIDAVRHELRERIDGVLALLRTQGRLPDGAPSPAATAEERIAQALARTMADYVGDLLAASEQRFEARLRAMEARLMALGTPPP